jgi:hypothetical protein
VANSLSSAAHRTQAVAGCSQEAVAHSPAVGIRSRVRSRLAAEIRSRAAAGRIQAVAANTSPAHLTGADAA